MAYSTRMDELYEMARANELNCANTSERITRVEEGLGKIHQRLKLLANKLEQVMKKVDDRSMEGWTSLESFDLDGFRMSSHLDLYARHMFDEMPNSQISQTGIVLSSNLFPVPEFHGINPREWIYKANIYFKNSVEDWNGFEKVKYAYYFMFGPAETWFVETFTTEPKEDWECFCEKVLNRFANGFVNVSENVEFMTPKNGRFEEVEEFKTSEEMPMSIVSEKQILHSNTAPTATKNVGLVFNGGVKGDVSVEEGLNVGKLSSLALPNEKAQRFSHLKLNSGVCYRPYSDKEETGGEDTRFICANEQVTGVADGAGGWVDGGVNAGLYARELMSNSVKAIQQVPNSEANPIRVLRKSQTNEKYQEAMLAQKRVEEDSESVTPVFQIEENYSRGYILVDRVKVWNPGITKTEKDQHDCRFLQRMFEEGTFRDVRVIFSEVVDHVDELDQTRLQLDIKIQELIGQLDSLQEDHDTLMIDHERPLKILANNPHLDATFRVYISGDWFHALHLSVRNFLSQIFDGPRTPALLKISLERNTMDRLKREITQLNHRLSQAQTLEGKETLLCLSRRDIEKVGVSHDSRVNSTSEAKDKISSQRKESRISNDNSNDSVGGCKSSDSRESPIDDTAVGRDCSLLSEEEFAEVKPVFQDSFLGHINPVSCCRFSASGGNIASPSIDGMVRIWVHDFSAPTSRNATIYSIAEVVYLEWDCKSDRLLLIDTSDGTIKAWNVDAKRVVCDLNPNEAYLASILDLKCRHVEPTFVSAAAPKRQGSNYLDNLGFTSLTVWNMKTLRLMLVLPLGKDPTAITSLSSNHNNKIFAAAATDGMIHMFDMSAGQYIRRWPAHDSAITLILFGPSETNISSLGTDGNLFEMELGLKGILLQKHDKQELYEEKQSRTLLMSNRIWDPGGQFFWCGNRKW